MPGEELALVKGLCLEILRHQADESLLTARQQEILSLIAAYPELTTTELALKLGVAHSTVRNLLSGAYAQLRVRNLAAAVVKARHLGLITTPTPLIEISEND